MQTIPTNTTPLQASSSQSDNKSTSRRPSVVAISASLLGVLTALWPNAPVLEAVNSAVPQLQIAIPLLLTSLGSILTAMSLRRDK